ncbi:MAG: CMP-N-acetylneuraminic acid synthetase [Oscillospiraceae bacterium]|jgi:CMP-N,N'-diacetyllegionaminic acid synthase|nr:CMP-N-acetylneuraminic acid synthetase [Oscillospiraceae bacterium]
MNILITICGRGGSTWVKNKNIRSFLGKPLLYYTIAAARLFKERRSADCVDIAVSSDSDVILALVRRFNLACIQRPAELAGDTTPKLFAIRHALLEMEKKPNRTYDYVIDLDITSPLRQIDDIEKALEQLKPQTDVDVVFSAVPARRNPYFNMVERKDGKMQKIIDGGFTARQQAPPVYDMNASIYCYRRDSILKKLNQSPLDGVFDIVIVKDTAVLDIDSEDDFELMEVVAKHFMADGFKEIDAYARRM